jgi:histidinol-phosphate aminotransferase
VTPFLPSRLALEAVEPYRIPGFERAGYLRLDVNEHPGGPPQFVVDAVHAALTTATLATYPHYDEWHARAAVWFGVGVDELTCTAGGDEAIKAICEAHLLPGKSLVTVDPGYDMFAIWSKLYGNPLVGVPLLPGFAFDHDRWIEAISRPDVGLVALVTPNNPTGTLCDRHTIEHTLQRVTCPVVIDETYAEFVDRSVADLLPKYPHLFIIRSFSKVHGLAGLRMGAVLSQAQNIESLRRVLNPFNVNRAAIAAALAVMAHPEATRAHVAEVTEARTEFVTALRAMGIETGPANANFVLAHAGARAGEITAKLAQELILVRNRTGSHPRLEGWLRIAIGDRAQMARTAGALRKVLLPPPPLTTLVFDMDGPLVDTGKSYRVAIAETARILLIAQGASDAVLAQVNLEHVEKLKRQGGLNNDWDCTAALIAAVGGQVETNAIYETFQRLYWGEIGDGLIAGEPFLVDDALQAQIAARFKTAIVTGRPRDEAMHTLKLNRATATWPVLVAMEDATAKPAPDGIFQALEKLQTTVDGAAYLGDSVDDMQAARAAGVFPIGVLPAGQGWSGGLPEKLYAAGAEVVFASVAEVLAWLQQ